MKPEWTKIAAIFSAFNPDIAMQLLQYCSRVVVLASALTHAEVFSSMDAKKDLEKGVDDMLKNLNRSSAGIAVSALTRAIQDAGNLGCLSDFLQDGVLIRRLMEIVKFGASRKRNADGVVRSSPGTW
jgi:hypothetical protein